MRYARYTRPGAMLAMTLSLAACQGAGNITGAGPAGNGARLFAENCTACHGAGGKGDGPMASTLPMPPADLTMLSAANGGRFPRDRVLEIVHGYPGQGHMRVMPDFGSRLDGPVVLHETEDGAQLPTPGGLIELVDYIQSLQVR